MPLTYQEQTGQTQPLAIQDIVFALSYHGYSNTINYVRPKPITVGTRTYTTVETSYPNGETEYINFYRQGNMRVTIQQRFTEGEYLSWLRTIGQPVEDFYRDMLEGRRKTVAMVLSGSRKEWQNLLPAVVDDDGLRAGLSSKHTREAARDPMVRWSAGRTRSDEFVRTLVEMTPRAEQTEPTTERGRRALNMLRRIAERNL